MNDYYVYGYFELGVPYYIGKGRGNRAYNKHRVQRPVDNNDIVIITENLDNEKALEIEHYLIKFYGRESDGGILLNRKPGGARNGNEGRTQTEEHKRKRSLSQKGKKRKPRSDETKSKISAALTGKQRRGWSEESKKRWSEKMKQNHEHTAMMRRAKALKSQL